MTDQDPSARDVATSLTEALRPFAARLAAERTLSSGKLNILRHLESHGQATTTELAAMIGVSPQAVSLAAKEMETSGFVERLPDSQDRRRAWLQLTDEGRRRLREESDIAISWLEETIESRLSAEETASLARLCPLLQRLTQPRVVE